MSENKAIQWEYLTDVIRNYVKKTGNEQEREQQFNFILKETKYRLPRTAACQASEIASMKRRIRSDLEKNKHDLLKNKANMEEFTQCKSRRALSGVLIYFDTRTQSEIAPEEYAFRFQLFAEEGRGKMLLQRRIL